MNERFTVSHLPAATKGEDVFDDSSTSQSETVPSLVQPNGEEVAIYVERARNYIQARLRSGVLYEFVKDTSLSFTIGEPGSGFWFKSNTGEVNLDPQWFIERGLNEEDIFWAMLHEIRHFDDYRENPETFEKLIEHCIIQAREVGAIVLAKWHEALDTTNPEHQAFLEKISTAVPFEPDNPESLTLPAYAMPIFKLYWSTLYNSLDDIWVNHGIYDKVGAYEPHKEGGVRVKQVYREVLFPRTDYTESTLANQFGTSFLRLAMLPEEPLTLAPEVEQARSTTVARLGRVLPDLQAFVTKHLQPSPGRNTTAEMRFDLIKKYLEPHFEKLIKLDLEKFKPEAGGSLTPYDGELKRQEEDSIDQLPSNFNDQASKFTGAKKGEQATAAQAKANADNLTPADKQAAAAARAVAARIVGKVNQDPSLSDEKRQELTAELEQNAEKYASTVEAIKPHIDDLALFWLSLIGRGMSVRKVDQIHKKQGSLNVKTTIQEWSTITNGSNPSPSIYDRQVSEVIKTARPEEIRLQLAVDMSGSMVEEKRRSLTKICVLVIESIRQLQVIIANSDYGNLLSADCQIIGYGDSAVEVKPFQSDSFAIEAVPQKLGTDLGSTYNGLALGTILDTYTDQDRERLQSGRLRSIVLEITDGGSSDVDSAALAIDQLLGAGAIVRGFQVGTNGTFDPKEAALFAALYNRSADDPLGEQVKDISELVPIIVRLLKRYTGDIDF